ncbi:MAG: DNA mismatch repair protein MutS [Deltaproteobacteria bacterium]|nr:DNA mismatch repair protein MutS [Deltaproteobacteria bacterium]
MNTSQSEKKLPPMLKLYLEYKEQYPDVLLFFQVGDFFEVFFDDAKVVANALNLTLTSRDKNSENPVPMCGVPIAVIDGYLDRLVALGHSAAVVKQVGDPKAAKGMVNRELERIVTPGVRILGNTDDDTQQNYVAALYLQNDEDIAIAFTDVRTGKVLVRDGIALDELVNEVKYIAPSELVLPREVSEKKIDRRSSWVRRLEESLASRLKFRMLSKQVSRDYLEIAGFASLSSSSKKAVSLLIDYVDETTVSSQVNILAIQTQSLDDVMGIDSSTRTHLELVKNVRDGTKTGTLLSVLDLTKTACGARKLRDWILHPSVNAVEINDRLNVVQFLNHQSEIRNELHDKFSFIVDLERLAARIELSAVNPRELATLRDSLFYLQQLRSYLSDRMTQTTEQWPVLFSGLVNDFQVPQELYQLLSEALTDEPPHALNDGGFIRDGYNSELDGYREVKKNGKSWIAELEAQEKSRTGITSLKIKFNNVFGYFIEITKSNLDKVPSSYTRRQTMANAERFITEELKQREEQILGAESKQIALEKRLYEEVKAQVVQFAPQIRALGEVVAIADLFCSLSQVALRDDLVRPEIHAGNDLHIVNGKHPVLSRMLESDFVPNTLEIEDSKQSVFVITGPNMGGKSTYLRQNALIVIMAQIGSYVPAETASIGIVDNIFTRIGASDNVLEGESTFMVEMREAAYILSKATKRSLLLVDELGRGTATQDGLAIAQSLLEWIVNHLSARTLFATHFHELTALADVHSTVSNLSVGSIDRDGEIIFTHQICKGAASKSYGLEVAKLAGLPPELLKRAREIMCSLSFSSEQPQGQLSFFSPQTVAKEIVKEREPEDYNSLKRLQGEIEGIDINKLTPLEALNALAQFKKDLH